MNDTSHLPLYAWIIIACLLLSQSIWLFRDAQKCRRNPWIWGIWGITGAPTPLIVYLIVVRKIFKKKNV